MYIIVYIHNNICIYFYKSIIYVYMIITIIIIIILVYL